MICSPCRFYSLTWLVLMVLCWGSVAPANDYEPIGVRPDRMIDESQVTYFVSVDGDDFRDGRSRETAFATLQKAADLLQPGETVLVTEGVYRQSLHINKRPQQRRPTLARSDGRVPDRGPRV